MSYSTCFQEAGEMLLFLLLLAMLLVVAAILDAEVVLTVAGLPADASS